MTSTDGNHAPVRQFTHPTAPGRTLKLVGFLLGLILLMAACSSSGSAGGDAASNDSGNNSTSLGELLPFADVQDTEFVFEGDPTNPARGIFRMKTTEAMICAIVWGETEDFGNFNNSLSMNGTGIIDHDVVLPGAEAGKAYFFRVQGTTADGSQYRSATGTFTIPELGGDSGDDAMIDHGINLALKATVTDASSSFGNGWEAQNAIDGDLNTEWASASDGDDGSITIDLGSVQDIAGVEFLTRSMLDGTATTEMFTITVDSGETFGPFPAGNPVSPNFAAAEFSGQEIRFDVETSTGGNVGAIEVRVFAAS